MPWIYSTKISEHKLSSFPKKYVLYCHNLYDKFHEIYATMTLYTHFSVAIASLHFVPQSDVSIGYTKKEQYKLCVTANLEFI